MITHPRYHQLFLFTYFFMFVLALIDHFLFYESVVTAFTRHNPSKTKKKRKDQIVRTASITDTEKLNQYSSNQESYK